MSDEKPKNAEVVPLRDFVTDKAKYTAGTPCTMSAGDAATFTRRMFVAKKGTADADAAIKSAKALAAAKEAANKKK